MHDLIVPNAKKSWDIQYISILGIFLIYFIYVPTAYAQPDLVCSITFLEKTELVPGEKFDAASRTFNQGNGNAFNTEEGFLTNYYLSTNAFYEKDNDFFIGGEFFGTDKVLAAGATFNEEEELDLNKDGINVPNGEYFLLLVTDPFSNEKPIGNIQETNENNNVFVFGTKITVGNAALPDLVCSITFLEKTELVPGEKFDAASRTFNQGNGNAFNTEEGFLTNYYLSTNAFYEKDNDFFIGGEFFGTDKVLAAGATFNEEEELDLNKDGINVPNGEYFLLLVTDPFSNEKPIGNIQETNENNNVFVFGTKITVGNAALPDLVCSITFLEKTELVPGEKFDAASRTFNQGNGNAFNTEEGFLTNYYLSTNAFYEKDNDFFIGGEFFGTDKVLAAGATFNEEEELDLNKDGINVPNGEYFLLLVTDPFSNEKPIGNIQETNENNNVFVFGTKITVGNAALPDLVCTIDFVEKTNLDPGDTFNARSTTRNQGDGAAFNNVDGFFTQYFLSTNNTYEEAFDFFIGGENFGINTVLQPNASITEDEILDLNKVNGVTIPNGEYFLLCVTDPFKDDLPIGFIEESNENNNVFVFDTKIIIDPPQTDPDLIGEITFVNDTEIVLGETIEANAIIKNIGDLPTSVGNTSGFFANFYLSDDDIFFDPPDVFVGGVFIPPSEPIAGNSERNISAVLLENVEDLEGLVPGCYSLLFQVDPFANGAPRGRVVEDNEDNNTFVFGEKICLESPLPDLAFLDQAAIPSTVFPGNGLTASFRLSNLGMGNAAPSTVCFFLSNDAIFDPADIELGELPIGIFDPDDDNIALSQFLTIPETTLPGNYFLIFVADCEEVIVESNETNNIATTTISIAQPLSDLTIVDPALSLTQLLPGETTTASLTLSNIGDGDAATSKVCFYLSTDNQLDGTDIILSDLTANALAAGEALALTQELLIPVGTVAGNYFILFEADCDQVIAESDETNNLSIVPISIDQPLSDLTIVDPALSLTQLLPGETTTASLTLSNIGDGDAATSKVCFYLSTDNQLDGTDIILSDLTANALAAGEALALTQELLIPVGTVAGNYFILFEADCDQLIAESDETNNLSIVPISIDQPLSDLTIVDPALSLTQLLPDPQQYRRGDAARKCVFISQQIISWTERISF